jgi:hypothetical protein
VASRAYVETSIPSFFFEVRTQPDMVARRDWTRAWWATASATSENVTSPAVLDELERGSFAAKQQCIDLVTPLSLLAIDGAVLEVLHLALASYHRCDFLVTWNCKHIANANRFGHIRRVNTLLGLFNPALVTPLELLGGIDDVE